MSSSHLPKMSLHVDRFSSLPAAVHMSILLLLPLAERTRCSLVSKRWAELLQEPMLWEELDFVGVASGAIDDETLLTLCRRPRGALRLLDVTSSACSGLELPLVEAPPDQPAEGLSSRRRLAAPRSLLDALARENLCGHLRHLVAWAPNPLPERVDDTTEHDSGHRYISLDEALNAETARAVVAACPSLSSASVELDGSPKELAAALQALPAAGPKRLNICFNHRIEWTAAAALADSVAALLRSCDAHDVVLWGYLDDAFFLTTGGDVDVQHGAIIGGDGEAPEDDEEGTGKAKLAQALQRMAAAFADPEHGPRMLRGSNVSLGASPLLPLLCRQISGASRLIELDLSSTNGGHCRISMEAAAALAGLLAPGRSRLQRLDTTNCIFESGLSEESGRVVWRATVPLRPRRVPGTSPPSCLVA